MKSYTDISQSKTLSKILPLESADMCYIKHSSSDNPNWEFNEDFPPMILGNVPINEITAETLPCWSLAVLLNLLPADKIITMGITIEDNKKIFSVGYMDKQRMYKSEKENMVDACYEMILKLHELNLL